MYLKTLVLNLNLEPKAVESIIEKVGIGFMFAPAFHPAMKYAARAETRNRNPNSIQPSWTIN